MDREGLILVHRVIARLNVGGPAIHVTLLTRAFDGRTADTGETFRARLLAGSVEETEGDMEYYARAHGVDVDRVPTMARSLSPIDDLRSFIALWRKFRIERPLIVHTHTAKAGTLGRLAAMLAGVPVRIHTYHGHVLGGDYFSPWLTRVFLFIERILARITGRLVVLTDAQKDEMSRELGVADPDRFAVVPLGLDLEPFAEAGTRPGARERARKQLEIGLEARVVAIVGRLVPIKNHELLLDAVALLRERRQHDEKSPDGPIRLVVVGSGQRETELRRYAEGLGIADAVVWLGWKRDLQEVYPAFDVLALTSRDEGTPVAIIEALASGVSVVARDVGGVSMVLEGGRWGRLVRDEDPEPMAEALDAALKQPPPRKDREAARASVLERFGVRRLVRDLESIYLAELDRHSLPWRSKAR